MSFMATWRFETCRTSVRPNVTRACKKTPGPALAVPRKCLALVLRAQAALRHDWQKGARTSINTAPKFSTAFGSDPRPVMRAQQMWTMGFSR